MTPHDFFNLLERKTELSRLRNSSVHSYPEEYLKRYNLCVDVINQLAVDCHHAFEELKDLKTEQFKHTANNYKKTLDT